MEMKEDKYPQMMESNKRSKNNLLLLSILIGITFSCTKNKVQGVWMGAYSKNSISNHSSFNEPLTHLLDIGSDIITVKKFHNPPIDFSSSIEEYSYQIKNDSLFYKDEVFYIEKLTRDSLIISKKKGKIVYTKLSDDLISLKNNDIQIQKGVYHLFSEAVSDTIKILNKNQLKIFNANKPYDSEVFNWRIDSYSEFSFFIIESYLHLPFLIEDADNFVFKTFHWDPKFRKWKLTVIDS